MELHGEGITGEQEIFQKPIFQTFGMFVGMTFGLVMHWFVLFFKIPFPGYPGYENGHNDNKNGEEKTSLNGNGVSSANYGSVDEKTALVNNGAKAPSTEEPQRLPVWMYFFLAIPSIFDLAATALCMMGLQYIDVSVYQLLRGSGM